jgi:hypothetical protein
LCYTIFYFFCSFAFTYWNRPFEKININPGEPDVVYAIWQPGETSKMRTIKAAINVVIPGVSGYFSRIIYYDARLEEKDTNIESVKEEIIANLPFK